MVLGGAHTACSASAPKTMWLCQAFTYHLCCQRYALIQAVNCVVVCIRQGRIRRVRLATPFRAQCPWAACPRMHTTPLKACLPGGRPSFVAATTSELPSSYRLMHMHHHNFAAFMHPKPLLILMSCPFIYI